MAVDSLGQLTVDLVANTGGFEKGMDRAQRSLKSATREAANQANQLDKLVGQIDPVVAAYGRLDKMEDQLRKHRAAGRLDDVDFKDYLKKLNEQRDAVGKSNDEMVKGGQSAKAYAAGLRNVPAQFTDIITSIQGGQAPLTVFLQQGGQLKDMFGGAGPAAKALGGYVIGLVNPLTVAAAAVAVLALAYKQGSDEATAYTTALAMTGNTAGTSADRLGSLAQQVALSGGTVGKASAVLTQLASSTRIPVAAFEGIAEAAVKYESATSQAADETVKNFEKIAKDPTAAILQLNESTNFLTATTYENIKSLQEQGKTQEAAAVATAAYEDGLNRTSAAVKNNLGTLESSWNAVKAAAKGAWDAALNVGRTDTLDQQIAALDKQLNAISSAKKLNKSDGFGNLTPDDSFREQALQREKTDKLVQKSEQDRRDAAKGFAQQQQQQSVADQIALDKIHKETETKADQRARELGEYRLLVERRVAQARSTGDKGLLISAEQQAKDIANINDKYKDSAVKKAPQYREDAGTKALDDARQQYAVLQRQGSLIGDQTAASQNLGAEAKKLVEWEQQLADIKGKKTLTADQKSLLASQDLITAQLKRNAAQEAGNVLAEKALDTKRKLSAFDENLKSQLSSAQLGLDNNLAGSGLGDVQKQRLQEQRGIQQSYQSQLDKLTSDYNKSGKDQFSTELYDKETDSLRAALDQRLTMQHKYYEDVDAAQADWSKGASSAYEDYLQSAKDVAGQTKSLFGAAFSGMEDAVTNFVVTGKASFGDFAKSVLADLARIAIRQGESQLLSSVIGIGTSLIGGATAGAGAGASASDYTGTAYQSWLSSPHWDGGYTGDGGKYEPKGVVHGGEVVIRKEVVQQPGMRAYLEKLNKNGPGYADGGYVGLSGGSSAMPAASSAQGPVVIQQNFSVPDASNDSSGADMNAVTQAYAETAKRGAQQAIAQELRQGGTIWRAINGR
jgi:lambda family phage tail tape measure protein